MKPTILAQVGNSTSSTNFWLSVAMFISLTVNLLGVPVQSDTLTGVVQAVASKEIIAILTTVTGAVITLYNLFKHYRLGNFKGILKDGNWYTGVITVIAAGLAMTNYNFSEQELNSFVTGANELKDAIFGGDLSLMVSTGWAFIVMVVKMFKNDKKEETPALAT